MGAEKSDIRPDISKRNITQPGTNQPSIGKHNKARPDINRLGISKHNKARPDINKQEAIKEIKEMKRMAAAILFSFFQTVYARFCMCFYLCQLAICFLYAAGTLRNPLISAITLSI